MGTNIIVGIDLGTTFSAIAYVNEEGRAEIIPNREGERITPSVVLFDGDAPIIGSIAKVSAASSPLNVTQFVKRQMGEAAWRFEANNNHEYTPEEISALILKRLKDDAQAALSQDIHDAVVTVPAYFNDAQRKSTQDAGAIAGLNVLRIINEPTAAALAYGIDKVGQRQTVLVYDLGGGTFDVTIMSLDGKEIEVIATGGDKNLGGFDWDNELMVYLNEEFKKDSGIDLLEDLATAQELREKAEMAKKTLASRDQAKVFLATGGKTASIVVTREQFASVTEGLLRRTETIMEMVLEDANLQWVDIDKILLVGGSTRMPAVPALIERVTGKKPSAELHPDEVVAMGAALLGALIQQESGKSGLAPVALLPNVKISDVNSHSLGVVAMDGRSGSLYNSIILPKDSKIPSKASKIYGTITDNQTEIEVEITEGEGEDIEYVKIVGKGSMRIPPYPQGAPVEVFFQYDADGIIHVTVFDRTADKMLGELDVKRESNRTDEEVQEMQRRISNIEVG